jgi:hypothetical protein
MIPVFDFDDGSVVLMDFKNQMPENVRRLIRRHWPNYAVEKTDGRRGAWDILSSAVNTSKTYTMKKTPAPFMHGRKPTVKLPVDWLITRSPSPGKAAYAQAVLMLKADGERHPKTFVDYMGKNQLVITEIRNEAVLPLLPGGTSQSVASSVPRLIAESKKELVIALLDRLELHPVTDVDVQIFDAAKDGFNLSIKADVQVRVGEKGFLFLSKQLPAQFVNILQGRAVEIIFLSPSDSSGDTIKKTLDGMKIPYSTVPYMFPVSTSSDLQAVKVIFPTLRIPSEKRDPYYLIDFAMDSDMYTLLHTQMGFTIIQY